VFGLYIAGLLRIGFLARTRQLQLREKPAGYVGSLIVGFTFAIGWTPCVGPILGAILSLTGTTDTVTRGIGLLVAYSAGLGVPFLLSAVALGAFLKFFKRHRPFIPIVERFAGVILVVVGLLVFTNYYLVLNSWAIRAHTRLAAAPALTPSLANASARLRPHAGFEAETPDGGRPPGNKCSKRPPGATSVAFMSPNGGSSRMACAIVLNDT
jgi:thiol:disulfide interchange protein